MKGGKIMDRPYDALKDYQSEITSIILNNESELEMSLEEYHLYDISRVVTILEPENITSFFHRINDDFSARI